MARPRPAPPWPSPSRLRASSSRANRPKARCLSPGGVPAPAVMYPSEPAEGSLPVAGGDAGAVVGHGKPDTGGVSGDSNRDAGTRIADSVVDEVAEHPAQPVGVSSHRTPLLAVLFLAVLFLAAQDDRHPRSEEH